MAETPEHWHTEPMADRAEQAVFGVLAGVIQGTLPGHPADALLERANQEAPGEQWLLFMHSVDLLLGMVATDELARRAAAAKKVPPRARRKRR